MKVKEAPEQLLGEEFTAQQRERLTRLRDDYAKRGLLDLPESVHRPADDRQTGRSEGLNRVVMKGLSSPFAHRGLGLLLIVISAVSFGVMPILARVTYAAGADPITVLLLRFGLAAAVMLAIMRARKPPFPRGRTLLSLFLMGAVGYAGVSLAYFTALTLASASLVALLLYLYPALVTLLSVIFLKERLGFLKQGALMLALAGTALTLGLTGSGSAASILLGMAAALLYAIYILVGSRVVHQAGSLASSTIVMVGASTAYVGLAAFHGWAFPQTVVGWGAIVAIALISTVLAFVTFFAGLKQVGPVTASTLSTWEPVVTVGLATLVLGEKIGLLQLLGGGLILLAAVALAREETT
jgi:drug/metabolite transporter (DMT)-like permease